MTNLLSEELIGRVRFMLFRVCDEQVPLFSSDRLKTLHRDCRQILLDLDKELNNN